MMTCHLHDLFHDHVRVLLIFLFYKSFIEGTTLLQPQQQGVNENKDEMNALYL